MPPPRPIPMHDRAFYPNLNRAVSYSSPPVSYCFGLSGADFGSDFVLMSLRALSALTQVWSVRSASALGSPSNSSVTIKSCCLSHDLPSFGCAGFSRNQLSMSPRYMDDLSGRNPRGSVVAFQVSELQRSLPDRSGRSGLSERPQNSLSSLRRRTSRPRRAIHPQVFSLAPFRPRSSAQVSRYMNASRDCYFFGLR